VLVEPLDSVVSVPAVVTISLNISASPLSSKRPAVLEFNATSVAVARVPPWSSASAGVAKAVVAAATSNSPRSAEKPLRKQERGEWG